MPLIRQAFLTGYQQSYERLIRPMLFRLQSAESAHYSAMRILKRLDVRDRPLLTTLRQMAFQPRPTQIGGVLLDYPVMLAAGFVKGYGFISEDQAMAAVAYGKNIIPGWRTMPNLVGAVEIGSITRYPRLGNQGAVIWRNPTTQSTQNRVGLRNAGAKATAKFLGQHGLAPQVGINLAVSPGVDDPDQEVAEVIESLTFFRQNGVKPAWYTLNLSCPNTEDDPHGKQTADHARRLCGAVVDFLGDETPLWVKVSPALADEQYLALMVAFAAAGVRAVIATNTLAQPSPVDGKIMAGVGGLPLHQDAVQAAATLVCAKNERGLPVDVIGCGGVHNRATAYDFHRVEVDVVQYWSALVYQGPLAGALLYHSIAKST